MDAKLNRYYKSMAGKRIAFCGVGRSNLPLIDKYLAMGAVVTACDRRQPEQIGGVAEQLRASGVTCKFGPDYLSDLDVDIIFRTPGMQFHLPELEAARRGGIAVTSEM